MNHPTLDVRSTVLLIAAAACWGIATVITKSSLATISPVTLLILQLTFSLILLWALVYFRGQPIPAKKEWLKVGLLGLLNPGLAYTLSLIGLTTTTASISTLLWASEPVLILTLAWLILRERLSAKLLLFSATAVAGVFLVSGLANQEVASNALSGNLWILSGVLCCAVYTVLVRRTGSTVDTLFTVAAQQTFALAWALLIWPLELTNSSPAQLLTISPLEWASVAVAGILYYALAYLCYLQGLVRVLASLASVFFNLIPIFGITGGYIFLGERLSQWQWIGASIVLVSVSAILLSQAMAAAQRNTPVSEKL